MKVKLYAVESIKTSRQLFTTRQAAQTYAKLVKEEYRPAYGVDITVVWIDEDKVEDELIS